MTCTIKQIFPKNPNFDQNRSFHEFSHSKFGNKINPYPITINKPFLKQLKEAHDVIIRALHAIVDAYFIDDDIQKVIILPKNIFLLLERTKDIPYKLQTMRPDYLITKDFQLKICEINARSPMNGFIYTNELADLTDNNYTKLYKSHDKSHHILQNLLDLFDLKKRIFIIRDKEPGDDINIYENELRKNSLINQNVFSVKPTELTLKNGKIEAHGLSCDQFMFECDQDELLSIPSDVLENIQKSVCVNDLRTLFISHDKRALAILSNMSIMSKYLSIEDIFLLKKYIIPTYLIKENMKEDIINNKNKWIFKKYLAGKGKDMYVGCDHTSDSIKSGLTDSESYILQPYIKQNTTLICIEDNHSVELLLVGMIISINEKFFGPGFFRASPNNITHLCTDNSWGLRILESIP